MFHAYREEYIAGAQRALGDMLDFAVNTCGLDATEFWSLFLVSDVSHQMEMGNPSFVSGKTGCELMRMVMTQSGLEEPEEEDAMYIDRSPEYWAGWAVGYYQWYTVRSFRRIDQALPIAEVIAMYPVYHEMDILQFIQTANERYDSVHIRTNLALRRSYAGLSQRELSEEAQVPLRQIQLFEQRRRDINKAGALTVMKLARVLQCRSEDLLEI